MGDYFIILLLFLVEWGTGEELLHIWYIFCHWRKANGRWGNCDWKFADIVRGSEAQVGGKFGQSLWLWSWPVVPGRNHQWDHKAGKYLVLHMIILLDIQTKGMWYVNADRKTIFCIWEMTYVWVVSQVCVVQPKVEIDLQLETGRLSNAAGYVTSILLGVTTLGTIAIMSGFFLEPNATYDDYVARVLPLFAGYTGIIGTSEVSTISVIRSRSFLGIRRIGWWVS